MRPFLVALGVGLLAVVVGVVFLWPSQRTGAEPIHYGRDTCARCRMYITQRGFAAELRDTSDVLTKYDDIGCMLQAMIALHQDVPEAWVEDHAGGGFVPLLSATLVRGERIESPMGYGIVAFEDEGAARAFGTAHGGEVLALEDVLREPTRMAPARKPGATTTREVGS